MAYAITNIVRVKQNDTARTLTDTLSQDGTALSLVSSSVYFVKKSISDNSVTVLTGSIVSAASGSVSYTFNTSSIGTAGQYLCEWQVIYDDETEITVPTEGYILMDVVPDLN